MAKAWTPQQAATRCGVSRQTMMMWIHKRRVRAWRVGTRWKVDQASVTLHLAERADRVCNGEGEGHLHALAVARFRAGANVADFVGEFGLALPVAQALFDLCGGSGRLVINEAEHRRLEILGFVGLRTGAQIVALIERLRGALRQHEQRARALREKQSAAAAG